MTVSELGSKAVYDVQPQPLVSGTTPLYLWHLQLVHTKQEA